MTITTPVTAAHIASNVTTSPATPMPKAADIKSATQSASTTASTQQQAALRQMLTKYAYDQSHGADETTLAALGKQIMAAAKALGQHVTLPNAPTTTDQGMDTLIITNPGSKKGKVDLTA
ncbi:MAG: hypothetical protein JO227_01395 [Acetobacteraceae bacterium]|nr:hypothetical protein [Acetobacteraceae bacterium]